LFISLVMKPPDEEHATALARAAFEAHEAVGVAAVLIVLVHWLWSVMGKADGGLAHLFPWSGSAWGVVKFVWAYWFGHVCLALVHKWAGHPNVKEMFSLKS